MGKSGEKLEKVGGGEWEKVGKSGEKWENMVKS